MQRSGMVRCRHGIVRNSACVRSRTSGAPLARCAASGTRGRPRRAMTIAHVSPPIASFQRLDLARGAMLAVAVLASLTVLVLLVTVLWLSFTSGVPGDPQLDFTLRHYVDTFLDGFTYRVLWNTVLFWL